MGHRALRRFLLLSTALACGLAAGACGPNGPTARITYVSPYPYDFTAAPATPTTPAESASVEPSASGSASVEPSASGSTEASPTATSTAASGVCIGTAENKGFYAEAVARFNFTVYCPGNLPAGWRTVRGTNWEPSVGKMTVLYEGPGGATLALSEGAFCTTSPSACSPRRTTLGPSKFGDLDAELVQAVDETFRMYVAPGTTHAYQLIGRGFDPNEFEDVAAMFIKAPGQ